MSDYLFTADEFAAKCLDLAQNTKTVYARGMWGWQITKDAITTKARQLPNFYTAKKREELTQLVGKGYWGFDCVCMIKSLLWGWGTDLDKLRGGAVYASNGVPDFGADSIGKYCEGFTSDFSNIEKGEVLWMPGHVGVYVGDGMSVECTIKWESKVLISALGNIGATGYHVRNWEKHGKLKWIDYKNGADEMKEIEALKKTVALQEKKVKALDSALCEVVSYIGTIKPYNVVYHKPEELPNYARPVITAMHDDGIFAGAGKDDMVLPYCVMRDLCIAASNGVYGRKYKKLIDPSAEVE